MSRFKKVVKKKELESALAKHPLKSLENQVKEDYIKGLVFIATEDENFDENERGYITSLMKNIGVDEAKLGEFETFASDCEEDELLAFMDRLKAFDEDIKINFMIEVVVIAFKDGEFDEAEQGMFDDYLEMLELTDKKDDIMYLATALINKDIDLALSFYTAKKEMFEKYDYMFDMVDIDIEKELKNVFSYEWTTWDTSTLYSGNMFAREQNDVGVLPGALVSLQAENIQKYCIFINSQIMSGNFTKRIGTESFESENEVILENGDISNLILEENLFTYNCDNNNIILLKDTSTINLYINWVNENIDKYLNQLQVILTRSVHNSYSSEDSKLIFQENSAGIPLNGVFEVCEGYHSPNNKNGKTYYDYVFYERGNFGGEANNFTKDASPSEFTFRLMKVEE